MTKIWTSYEGGDKIIAYIDGKIYKANPKDEELENIVADMKMNDFSSKKLFGISPAYLKEVRLQEGKEYIQVFFGKESEEHLQIKDPVRREEIFNYFKDNIPDTVYQVDRYSKMKAGKKPMAALIVVGVLLLWALFYSVQIDAGAQFELVGGRITGLILGIASMGTPKTLMVFGSLMGIAAISMIAKMRNPPVMHRIAVVPKAS
jgi:hypothetical protein